jgi:AraC-like DNA-binding protein
MSQAVAVHHGAYGRVCLYAMDRAMAPHGHREGHLVIHVQGPPAELVVDDAAWPLSPGQAVAVSPWRSHYYRPRSREPVLALVLYIRPAWFLEASRRASVTLSFGRAGIEVTDSMAGMARATARAMLDPDREDPMLEERVCDLTQAAYDQSWQWTEQGAAFIGAAVRRDHRIRKALRLIRDNLAEAPPLDCVAREVGLSRPHFYKLFRAQVGLTPTLYLNALRMEQAIDRLAGTREAVSEIGFDLGFSSQASFSRFFISNGVVPPSAYRRSAQVSAAC